MKYLVTDDSKMARKMVVKNLKTILKDEDQIIEATNGQEAFEVYKKEKPDLCFMDLTMPIMDGFEATLEIKQYDSEAKIIIISADIQEGSIKKAQENGALKFIKKPINIENLKKILLDLDIL